jgi:hypothetical protein
MVVAFQYRWSSTRVVMRWMGYSYLWLRHISIRIGISKRRYISVNPEFRSG